MELDDRDLVSPFAIREPRLREDVVCASSCHGETNELHRGPLFECFETVGGQCIPRDFYRLILQPMLVDKVLRCDDTTRCTVLERLKFRDGEDATIGTY